MTINGYETNELRAMCAELVDELHGYASANPHHDSDELVARARALLDQQEPQPEPEGPTDEELLAMRSWSSHSHTFDSDLVDFARAVLARYGRPKPPTLKEQALYQLDHITTHDDEGRTWGVDVSIIRRALEALDD